MTVGTMESEAARLGGANDGRGCGLSWAFLANNLRASRPNGTYITVRGPIQSSGPHQATLPFPSWALAAKSQKWVLRRDASPRSFLYGNITEVTDSNRNTSSPVTSTRQVSRGDYTLDQLWITLFIVSISILHRCNLGRKTETVRNRNLADLPAADTSSERNTRKSRNIPDIIPNRQGLQLRES